LSHPKILIGTLECGEAEFELCRQRVAAQEGAVVEHLVFSNLPELEAHQRLFEVWNLRRQEFDLFVKVDADTVLADEGALSRLWALFAADPDVTAVQAGLHDYFTDEMIAGLNCFSREVSFSRPTHQVYCDRMEEIGHRRVLKPDDTRALYPIAHHCLFPHPRQAFHYGYRRWLKGQTDVIAKTTDAFERLDLQDGSEDGATGRDARQEGRGRFWALAGACAAFWEPLEEASYEAPAFSALWHRVERDQAEGRLPAKIVLEQVRGILAGSLGVRARRFLYRTRRRLSPRPQSPL